MYNVVLDMDIHIIESVLHECNLYISYKFLQVSKAIANLLIFKVTNYCSKYLNGVAFEAGMHGDNVLVREIYNINPTESCFQNIVNGTCIGEKENSFRYIIDLMQCQTGELRMLFRKMCKFGYPQMLHILLPMIQDDIYKDVSENFSRACENGNLNVIEKLDELGLFPDKSLGRMTCDYFRLCHQNSQITKDDIHRFQSILERNNSKISVLSYIKFFFDETIILQLMHDIVNIHLIFEILHNENILDGNDNARWMILNLIARWGCEYPNDHEYKFYQNFTEMGFGDLICNECENPFSEHGRQ